MYLMFRASFDETVPCLTLQIQLDFLFFFGFFCLTCMKVLGINVIIILYECYIYNVRGIDALSRETTLSTIVFAPFLKRGLKGKPGSIEQSVAH